ncbi:hypothetical protein [Moorena sp. SIOASIH]|nr:hypothetical protein [Moorena sp. SIOASIH]
MGYTNQVVVEVRESFSSPFFPLALEQALVLPSHDQGNVAPS